MCARVVVLLFAVACFSAMAEADDVYRIGPGVTPPKLLSHKEPSYTEAARSAGIQGMVMLEIVIGTSGKVDDITVISPIGFGLDERAQETVRQWVFKPGEKDGKPVKVRAMVEVNFRFEGMRYDTKAEKRRTSFNVALRRLESKDPKVVDQARQTMQDLAKEKFVPAMYVVAIWMREGGGIPQDRAQSLKMLSFAASKDYGPALYELGRMHLEGRELPLDTAKGLQLLRDAAVLGSVLAQFDLGLLHETGNGVPADVDKSRRYFRLCATAGQARCQFRLGKMLLNDKERLEREYIQGIAWLQLAADSGHADAKSIVEQELPKLSSEQGTWVATLKRQLVAAKR